jgi:hypothetical protein
MPAFYRNRFSDFLSDDIGLIVGCLTGEAARAGFYQQVHAQTEAWQTQIRALKDSIQDLQFRLNLPALQILLEYPIPRRAKRIDAVLLAAALVIVLEFKCGADRYAREGIAQVEDYCLDLRDFHKESLGRTIVPILVATNAPETTPPDDVGEDLVKPTWLANARDLGAKLSLCLGRYDSGEGEPIDPTRWDRSDYTPTPTIIEAAQALYAGQNVREISRCQGGIENLARTTDTIISAVEEAKARNRKRICFVTGVPGAGKTLAGLNIVHNKDLHEKDLGVFLSGNGPLVRVLTEALARDGASRLGQSRSQSRRRVETFVQNVHRFIDVYYGDPSKVPVDKVVVFDEAQRAWDAAQSARKFHRAFSEPEILMEIMDRHFDWSVIVALVGSGQEINRGEAGLAEWGRAISSRFRHWDVFVSPELKVGIHSTGTCLFRESPNGITVVENTGLHLSVNIRSYKAAVLSEFVDAILKLDREHARSLARQLDEYPILLTRDLARAKAWLRGRRRGHRRIGLIASSGARRLRAHGLNVTESLDVEDWFLNGPDDVRSSHYLEVPATEFGIQGLELDWTGVCWGGDLYPSSDGWICRSFRGAQWNRVRDASIRQYILNKYRVLLTRAREGMVMWVPPGDRDDPTRPPKIYDQVADYLMQCGIQAST